MENTGSSKVNEYFKNNEPAKGEKQKMKDSKDHRKNLIEIGQRIKKIRLQLGLRQKEMAGQLQVPNSYLSDIECGKGNPGHLLFFKLTTQFNVSLDYLFHGSGETFLNTQSQKESKKETAGDRYVDEIKTIEDLIWYLKNSTIFYHQIMALASRFQYENEEIIKRNIEKHRSKKTDQ
jgi:transcriptional regulator with XRE-family HTH domain